jgi:hypothetical protein
MMVNPMFIRRSGVLVVAIGLLGATACGAAGITETTETENPGTQLFAQSGNGNGAQRLVWTRDGTELVFHSDGLKAVSVGTHTVRPVWGESAVVDFAGPTVSGKVYFSTFLPPASTNPEYKIARVEPATGTTELLPLASPSLTIALEVSPDERYVVGDAIYDLQTGGKANSFPYTPLGFSPDGSVFLARDPFTPALLVVTGQGYHQQLATSDEAYIAHRWAANIPQLLRMRYDAGNGTIRLYEIAGLSGASRDLAQLSSTGADIYANYSADGNLLGVWIQQQSLWKLYVIRAGSPPVVAASVTYTGTARPGAPVFSPDGKSAAYFFYTSDRSLYVQSGI